MTPGQKDVYDFIISYIREKQISPTYDDLVAKFGSNRQNAWMKVQALARQGLLNVSPRVHRGIRLVEHICPKCGCQFV